jgi:hypothetical protein
MDSGVLAPVGNVQNRGVRLPLVESADPASRAMQRTVDFLLSYVGIIAVCNAQKVIHFNGEKVIHLRLVLTIRSGPL